MQAVDSAATDDSCEPPSLRVLERIAAAENVDAADLRPPLHDVVDPTALDRLFESTASTDRSDGGRVSFRYRGYDVVVHADSRVELHA